MRELEQIVLEATTRDTTHHSTVSALRKSGRIPAIVYGKDQEPLAVSVSEKLFQQRGALAKSLVELHVGDQQYNAIVQQIQRDPVSRRILHIDFYRVHLDEPIVVSVPLHVTGIDEVERRRGVVQLQTREVEIEALPVDMPEVITVDISHLEPGEHLSVGEITLPPKVTLRSEPDEVVVTVLEGKQTEEEEEQPAAEGETTAE
jgi:large subunit ribosomal protein L25